MRKHILLFAILVAGIIGIPGCASDNAELKRDAGEIAGVMCRSIEAMRNLKSTDPADSALVMKLQSEHDAVEAEMTALYADFRKKWGEKISDKQFGDEFRKYLNEAMLDCKSLSKEDRENFERGVE